jgi:hypothetical protein
VTNAGKGVNMTKQERKQVKREALREYRRGDLLKTTAERHKISTATISLWAAKDGQARRQQGCRVKTSPSERDIEIVKAVKAVVDGKPTLAEIGKPWGTSRANVHRIFHTWKDWKPNGAVPAQSTHQVVGPDGGNIIDIHAAVHLGPTPETEANVFEWAAADKAPVEICGPAAQKVDQEQAKRRAYLITKVKRAVPYLCNQWRQLCMWLEELRDNPGLHAPYRNFAELCQKEFRLLRSTCFEYANAGRIVRILQAKSQTPESTAVDWLPTTWAQVRPLTRVDDDEKAIEIWSKAVVLYPGGVTEAKVKEVRDQVIGAPAKHPTAAGRAKLWRAIRNQFEAEYDEPVEVRRSFIDKGRELFQSLAEELSGVTVAQDRQDNSAQLPTPLIQHQAHHSKIGPEGCGGQSAAGAAIYEHPAVSISARH